MQPRTTRLALSALLLLAFACGSPAVPRTVSLRVRGAPRDALVVVDEQTVGSLEMVATRGVALPSGRHFLTVQRPGYFPFDKILDVKAGDPPVYVEVTLTKLPE